MAFASSFVHRVYQSSGISETAAGKPVRIPLGDIPSSIEGYVTHVAGFLLRAKVRYDAVAVTMPAAMPAYLLDAAVRSVRLESEGHAFLENVDGVDIKLDHVVRTGTDGTNLTYANIADGDATDQLVDIEIVCRLDNPAAEGPARWDGIVPVALLDHKSSSNNVLSFQVASTFDGFPGVSIDGFTECEVFALCVSADQPRMPSPHRLRYVQSVERTLPINVVGAAEYLLINTRDNGSTWVPTPANFGDLSLTAGNSLLWAGRSATELGYQAQIQRGQRPGDALKTGVLTEWLTPYVQAPGTMRTKMLKGRVLIQTGTRNNYSDTRVLYRETGVHNTQLQTRWLNRLGIRGEARRQAANTAPGKGRGAAHFLDHKVSSPEVAQRYPSSARKM